MKRLLSLVLALVMLLGILAGCGVATKTQTGTVQSTAETTVPAAPHHEEGVLTPGDLANHIPVTHEEFFINGVLLYLPKTTNLFDCGGEKIRPFPSKLDYLNGEVAISLCVSMVNTIQSDNTCTVEDYQQAGVNFAYLLVQMQENEYINSMVRVAAECFGSAKTAYPMDQLYPWVLVGLSCPEILLEYFSGNFSDTPDMSNIAMVQSWIPDLLYLEGSDELEKAIDQNPWFELEYLPAEEG